MLEMFRKRWTEGLDLGDDAVIGDAAERADLDRGEILAAAHDPELRSAVANAWNKAMERDEIFGVPSFVFAGRPYWGQDRMKFLRAAVERKRVA